MARIAALIVRLAGAAAIASALTMAGLSFHGATRADEMIDLPATPRKAKSTTKGAKPASRPPEMPAAGRAAQSPSPAPGQSLPPTSDDDRDAAPKVSDPRIDKLMEGARKAWESIGQKGGGQKGDGQQGGRDAAPPATQGQAAQGMADATDLNELKATFRRPLEARTARGADPVAALGARLFTEKKLSSDHKMSCATCHDPAKSFNDARTKTVSRLAENKRRNTPSLWNTGFAKVFGWSAGATDLESQVKAEIEREGEMDGTLEAATVWLARDGGYVQAFDAAFGRAGALTTDAVAQALVAYVKTLVSPPTRFDQWAEGDADALTGEEIEGFRLFAGKAGCAACHNGWRFTDDAARSSGGRSVKTPGLREAMWSAPYMADGRAATMGSAITHAAKSRGSGSLAAAERAALLAFVKTLSSAERPVPSLK